MISDKRPAGRNGFCPRRVFLGPKANKDAIFLHFSHKHT